MGRELKKKPKAIAQNLNNKFLLKKAKTEPNRSKGEKKRKKKTNTKKKNLSKKKKQKKILKKAQTGASACLRRRAGGHPRLRPRP